MIAPTPMTRSRDRPEFMRAGRSTALPADLKQKTPKIY